MKKQIQELLAQMTLEEKIGQLQQCGPSIVGTFEVSFGELLNMKFDGRISEEKFSEIMADSRRDYHEEEIRNGQIGSLNGITGRELCNRLQKIAVEESRLGIPLLFGADVIHGFRTVFPIPLGQSCSWNPALVEKASEISAKEASSAGLHWTFSPMLDIARDARWGRAAEGYGEDPYLAACYAAAAVSGYQGADVGDKDRLLACAKHFVAYGAAEAGRDYNTTSMDEGLLYNIYLPVFASAIKAGCASVMPAFNDLNGIPCTVNERLLNEILREQLGFEGATVSDSNAIAECVAHGVAEDKSAAAEMSLRAGIDVDMSSNSYMESLKELISSGRLPESVLDKSVMRVLSMKQKKGLFENPYKVENEKERESFLLPEYRETAKQLATESIVLLKNNGALPLPGHTKIAVIGSLAQDASQMLGCWSINGEASDVVTILEAMQMSANIAYAPVCGPDMDNDYSRLEQLMQQADVFVAVVGEKKEISGEAASRVDLSLPNGQALVLKKLAEAGKKVITLVVGGRPLVLSDVERHSDALLMAWHLGVEAGPAVRDILYGEREPVGRLTMSFPRSEGQCPIYYNHPPTGRPGGKSKFTSKYLDCPPEPLFPFGFGLGYATVKYNTLTAEISHGYVEIQVSLTNQSKRDAVETVQVYARDVLAKNVRPVKELKAFKRVYINGGGSLSATIQIPVSDLGYYRQGYGYVIEPGDFIFYAGANSRDCLEARLTLSEREAEEAMKMSCRPGSKPTHEAGKIGGS